MSYDIAGYVLAVAGLIFLVYKLEASGRKQERQEHVAQVLDDIHKAAAARDRLHRDPADAKRVRDRFTR